MLALDGDHGDKQMAIVPSQLLKSLDFESPESIIQADVGERITPIQRLPVARIELPSVRLQVQYVAVIWCCQGWRLDPLHFLMLVNDALIWVWMQRLGSVAGPDFCW